MELSHPFIKLPYSFDVDRLQHELSLIEDSAWMAHPSRMQGNAAVPLVSLNGKQNDDFSGHMMPTKHLNACPYIQQIMANFDEVIARSRLMSLAPGAIVDEHVDFNYHWYSRVRIHIPITTTPEVLFYCGDAQTHMAAGECWLFDSWRRHKVINASDHTRVHLVIDTSGSSRFWQQVESMARFAPAFDQQEFLEQSNRVEYQLDHTPSIKTEKYNVAPVMAPGEMDGITKELLADLKLNPDNDHTILRHYQDILMMLCRDWRQTWLQHGHEKSGIESYQQLLNKTVKQLHKNPRVLTTSSNDVGVNPIIMQRILRSALNVEQFDRFIN